MQSKSVYAAKEWWIKANILVPVIPILLKQMEHIVVYFILQLYITTILADLPDIIYDN